MTKANDELDEAIKGLEEAGAVVNSTKKPVKPIREVKKKKVAVEGNPTDGMVTFAEDEGPFKATPAPMATDEELAQALDDCGVGYVPAHDEPNVADEGSGVPFNPETAEVDATKAMLIRKYAQATHSIYTTSPGTPQERTYGTQSVWNYVIALNDCFVRVLKLTENARGDSTTLQIERDVYCLAELVSKVTGETLNRTIMCASTDEDFVSKTKNKLSVAYGLAQTRAEERLARMTFGYQVALAGLQPTPAEELDVVEKWWGAKDKEL